jgi:hypothetical protein
VKDNISHNSWVYCFQASSDKGYVNGMKLTGNAFYKPGGSIPSPNQWSNGGHAVVYAGAGHETGDSGDKRPTGLVFSSFKTAVV